jgi:PiT family inorganic phosphate transporter
MASLCNLVGAFAFGVHVAATVGKGIVDPQVVTPLMVTAALSGAIFWTYICTHFGFPISVSHALIGGLVGAASVVNGTSVLIGSGIAKIAAFIVLSPLLGMLIASIFFLLLANLFRSWSKQRIRRVFSKLQIVSAAAYGLSHGTNDAQKTMGIISVLLFSAGMLGKEFYVPTWVIFASTMAIGLGTLLGGWRVIRTMGTKITHIGPLEGFAAETAGSCTVISCSLAGIPVSTTHTITGCIMGVGVGRRIGAVRWGVAKHILWAWVLTIPVCAAVGAASHLLLLATGW